MSTGTYKKLFFDLNKARLFGKEVAALAQKITVPAGRNGKAYEIFTKTVIASEAEVHNYYYIEKDQGVRTRDIYYVGYSIYSPSGASKADMLQAKWQIEEFLNQKYRELGPDRGISRA